MSFIFPPVFLRLPSVKPSCSFHFEIKMSRCLLFVVINFPLFKCFQQEITVVVLPWIPHPWRDDPCLELSLVIPEQSALLSEVVMIKNCVVYYFAGVYIWIFFHSTNLSWAPTECQALFSMLGEEAEWGCFPVWLVARCGQVMKKWDDFR